MNKLYFFTITFILLNSLSVAKDIYSIDEKYVCEVKTSCEKCLQIENCTWCDSMNKCYSEDLVTDGYCENETKSVYDFGLSYEANAQCACSAKEMKQNCKANDEISADEPECSGRGVCKCGRCVCNNTDLDYPSKMVFGEYCELDNFSCDGPECGEGPFPLNLHPPVIKESASLTDQ